MLCDVCRCNRKKEISKVEESHQKLLEETKESVEVSKFKSCYTRYTQQLDKLKVHAKWACLLKGGVWVM